MTAHTGGRAISRYHLDDQSEFIARLEEGIGRSPARGSHAGIQHSLGGIVHEHAHHACLQVVGCHGFQHARQTALEKSHHQDQDHDDVDPCQAFKIPGPFYCR